MYCDFSFQRFSITMVNKNGLLEDLDLESESLDGLGSQSEFFTPREKKISEENSVTSKTLWADTQIIRIHRKTLI